MRERQKRERLADSSGVHVWLVLMKAHRSLLRHAERSIVSLDMCISDFGVLEMLLHKGSQSVSEIGRRVELTIEADNLFNVKTPGCVSCDVNNMDPTIYDTPGRYYYARIGLKY